MMGDRGAFSGLLRFSSECRCGVGGCDGASSAYPVAANSKDSANTPAANVLTVAVAENAVVAGTTAYRNATDPKPLDMTTPLNDRR
jgi:hypothetical protein